MENRVREKKEKQNIICFWVLVGISFVSVWIYNTLTPLMSDDLLFDKSLYHSIGDIFYQEYLQYFNWTGRSVLQICLKFSSLMPKNFFNIINSFMFVVLSLLIYANIQGRKKQDIFLYMTIQLFLWLGVVDFSQTILWLGGACNYLWGMVFILSFITMFRKILELGKNASVWQLILLLVISFLAGWGNENTSGGAIFIVLLLWGYDWYEKKECNKNGIYGIIGACIGFAFLILSPSNKHRSAIMAAEETYTGITALISRGLKIIQVYKEYFYIYLAAILFMLFFLYWKKTVIHKLVISAIFLLSGIATGFVLLFTPQPMNRAYFGAGIFLIIATIQLLWILPDVLSKDFLIVRNGWVLVGMLWLAFVYVENGANLTRILRETKEREEFITAELERDCKDIVLPKLRSEFKTPYTYAYENDIKEDIHWWMNEVYCQYYGLDTITAVERDEWDETH